MHRFTTHPLASLTAALLLLAVAAPASAMFMQPQLVPTDRLITNLTAYIEQHPEEAQAHFLLGRVHYMAFINQVAELPSGDAGSKDKLPNLNDPRQYWQKNKAKKINEAATIDHARKALAAYQKAVELEPENGLYHLGLAGLYQQAAPKANLVMPADDKAQQAKDQVPAKQQFLIKAAAANLKAYQLDREAALKKHSVFLPFYPVAYEAGKAYLDLVDNHGIPSAGEDVEQKIAKDLNAIDSMPQAITPIVMRVTGEAPKSLTALTAPGKTVRFDLDADGVAERRPWVSADTAILVWDPDNTGRITSGKQLFGNMTFFMIFDDGYQALASLDDNGDRQLTGAELKGLALWHDRNANGVSEPGEVTPIAQTAVTALRTRATGKQGIHPMNAAGVTLRDGTTRATWDWIIPAVNDAAAEH